MSERARIVEYIRNAFPRSRIAATIARDIEAGAPLLITGDGSVSESTKSKRLPEGWSERAPHCYDQGYYFASYEHVGGAKVWHRRRHNPKSFCWVDRDRNKGESDTRDEAMRRAEGK